METVLVGIETPVTGAVEPLRWAADYCEVVSGELLGVVVNRPTQSEVPPDWYEEELADLRKQAETELDVMASAIPHRLEVRDGDSRTAIAEVATDEHVGAVVVAVTGSGGFRGLRLGSVAHHLADHLPVPVVAVPALGGPSADSPGRWEAADSVGRRALAPVTRERCSGSAGRSSLGRTCASAP